jgi:hypothetical protein
MKISVYLQEEKTKQKGGGLFDKSRREIWKILKTLFRQTKNNLPALRMDKCFSLIKKKYYFCFAIFFVHLCDF